MCGIFGVISGEQNNLSEQQLAEITKDLFILSESRGKEASGFATLKSNEIIVHKTPFPASKMVKSVIFKTNISESAKKHNGFYSCIGHSRLVTNGYEHFNYNNQPVIKEGMVGVHNGIIVNIDNLWTQLPEKTKQTDLDSEIIPVLFKKHFQEVENWNRALKSFYEEIYGMTNTAFFSENHHNLLLATNNGSIYYINDGDNGLFIFASEYYILEKLMQKHEQINFLKNNKITQLQPKKALSVSFTDATSSLRDLLKEETEFDNIHPTDRKYSINEILLETNKKEKIYQNSSLEHLDFKPPKEFVKNYEERKQKIEGLKRCSRCILPETFPYIEFNEHGVCNYCSNYKKIDYKGEEAFRKELEPYRKKDERPEILLPFSGGRDSSFSLHYIVKELGMKPLAYSYDWGMITDLARRNQARMCDKLGVEHILVSADIRKKRANIRKNVLAWLKRPSLGTVPLFMAGDKQYFYFANLLMKQNNLNGSILGENLLETTKFKSGFCGVVPKFNKEHTYFLTLGDKIKMMAYYGKEYLLNPAYINSSLLDTLDAFKSYYVIEHRNVNLFDYIRWDEKKIEDTLINDYEWETDPGTKTTWRIGDGTAAFYNYIYYMLAGFTENDTFRSNQIREGDMTREKALERSKIENQPRWDSIKWYCNTINVDFESTIEKINKSKSFF